MIARADGQVVLVAGAIEGERVRARIERVAKGTAFAAVEAVLVPSAARRAVTFDPRCGGCVYAHIAAGEQPAVKRTVLLDALRRGGRLEWSGALPVHAAGEEGYRMRARLHVRRRRAGFFREGTHELCDPAPTRQLLPATLQALADLLAVLPRPLAEELDSIEISENLPGDLRACHLVPADARRVPARAFAGVGLVDGVTGVTVADPASRRPVVLAGEPTVSDPLENLTGADAATPAPLVLRRHAPAFFQANRYLLRTLVSRVTAAVDASPAIDLYAGVGLFAIALAARGHDRVIAVEEDAVSGADLRVNAAPFRDTVEVEGTSVEHYLRRLRPPADATVIVDPPRTGLSRQALDGVLAARPRRVVYLSCDVATLARDLRRILDAGYAMTSLEAFDLFPNTAHVEALAVLDRQ